MVITLDVTLFQRIGIGHLVHFFVGHVKHPTKIQTWNLVDKTIKFGKTHFISE